MDSALLGISAAIIGALVGWAGNYHVQHRLHRNLQRIDELRRALYDYLDLVANYWTSPNHTAEGRRTLEARMIVAQLVISSEYRVLSKLRRGMKKSIQATTYHRLRLWDAATGGCFQQENWDPDPDRVQRVAREVNMIVKTFG